MNEGMNTQQPTSGEGSQGNGQRTVMGILAYLGVLVLIPYFVVKQDAFVKFHIRQGFVLLGISVVSWFLGMMMWQLWMIVNIVNFGIIVLVIIGIINVVKGEQKELPLVGTLAQHIKI